MITRLKFSTSWMLAVLAGGAGIAAFWSTQRFLDDSTAGVRRQWESRYQLSTVLVAARDLTPGQTVAPGDLARRDMPAGFLPSGTFAARELDAALGQRLAVALRAGDPLSAAMLEARAPALSRRLPEGARAVTVPVDQVSSQGGLVRPGDRVDLMLAEERLERGERCVVVRSLLESVHVLATGQATREALRPGDPGADPDTRYSTITLDVTPEQAQQLAVGLRMGELIPMLRGAGDDAPTGLDALGDGRLACRELMREAPGEATASPRRWAVDLLVGGLQGAGFRRVWVTE